jgi:GntR family transcriptional repressor for pyruvate dehydrogenase complex
MKQAKLSDIILQTLETRILEGSLLPGQRLPPERELAKQFDVSRPSLREAIQKLEAKGLVVRRQGGGTFVCEALSAGVMDPLLQLLSQSPEGQLDLLEFRYAMEGVIAYYAALRGTEVDLAALSKSHEAIEASWQRHEPQLQAQAVVRFYEMMAEASHNQMFLHLIRGLSGLLESNISHNFKLLYLREGVGESLSRHRKHLLEAIVGRDPVGAREASLQHLAFIEETLLEIRQEESRIERSIRRQQQNS